MKYVMEVVLQLFLANTTVPMFNTYSTKEHASRASALRADDTASDPLDQTHTMDPTPDTPGA